MKRESFKSRLGFLLVSAGCAIGIGNVWRFPYVAGQNGGGLFVLLYLIFLVIMGLPVLTMELAGGRAGGPPQPASRTQPAASAAAERTSFRRIFIEDFPLLSLNFQGPAAPKNVGPRPLSVYHNEVRIANELQDF